MNEKELEKILNSFFIIREVNKYLRILNYCIGIGLIGKTDLI